MTPDLILASASPRRRELLTQIGVRYRVSVVPVDESRQADEQPAAWVERLARAKVMAARAEPALRADTVAVALPTLGADTLVVVDDDEVFGKPVDAADAVRMLRRLSGREHRVLTAVAVADDARMLVRCSETRVWFRPLDEMLIARYVATGEPADKAGAWGIQGLGAALVARIDGSYSGVVGLPLAETIELLALFGVPFWRDFPVGCNE